MCSLHIFAVYILYHRSVFIKLNYFIVSSIFSKRLLTILVKKKIFAVTASNRFADSRSRHVRNTYLYAMRGRNTLKPTNWNRFHNFSRKLGVLILDKS